MPCIWQFNNKMPVSGILFVFLFIILVCQCLESYIIAPWQIVKKSLNAVTKTSLAGQPKTNYFETYRYISEAASKKAPVPKLEVEC